MPLLQTPTPKLEKPYTVKCSLVKLCKDEALRKHLSDAALNMYELVVEVQQLMNLALRVRFEAAHKKGEVPHQEAINEKYVQKYFYAVTDQEGKVSLELRDICREHYHPLLDKYKIARIEHVNLPLDAAARRIAATVNTNIQQHFLKRQLKCLMVLHNCDKKVAYEKQAQINNVDREHVSLPVAYLRSSCTLLEYLDKFPEEFLYPMYLMNKLLEDNEKKCFALLPLSRGFVPGAHLHLDTRALIELLGNENVHVKEYKAMHEARLAREREQKENEEMETETETETRKRRAPGRDTCSEAMEEKDKLWNALFHVRHVAAPSRVQNKRICFGHHITTDGVSVSAVIYREGSAPKKKRWRKKKTLEQVPASEEVDCPEARKYAGLNVEVVGVDPGKHNLVFMTTERVDKDEKRKSGRSLHYTGAQRRHESGQRARKKKLDKNRSKAVEEAEQKMASVNSRVSSVDGFEKYLEKRYEVQAILGPHGRGGKHRLYRFWNWSDRRSSEDRFITRVKKTFIDTAPRMKQAQFQMLQLCD